MSRTLEEIKAKLEAEARNEPPEGEAPERRSIATILVSMALERYHLLVSDAGEAFAVPREGPRVTLLLRGGRTSLRAELARLYYKRFERAAPQQALTDALGTLEGFAQDTKPVVLHQRVAEHHGALWLDLGDATGRAVRITPHGWTVELMPPVHFRRSPLTAALPTPERDGDLTTLWRWANVEPDDRPLTLAWLIATLYPAMPHPVLGLFGEQGTGKTTLMRLFVSLLDASPVPYRKPPRDADSWVTAASGSWIVALDNLSVITDWLSDTLCRAVTGEGDVRRRLYTDNSLAVFSFIRCVILSGIDLGSLNGDLADRLLPISLHRIADADRRSEARMWTEFQADHARLLGAVLDLAASVASVLPSVDLGAHPRMADFARILAAVDQVMGTDGLKRYLGTQSRLAADTLTADPFIVELMERITSEWQGTSAELLVLLEGDGDARRPKDWPGTARVVTQRLRRQAPVLRKIGWQVSDDGGKNKTNALEWTLVPPQLETERERHSPHSPRSLMRSQRDELGEHQASVAPTPDSPHSPHSPDTRQDNADGHGQTSMARMASIENDSTLAGDSGKRIPPPGAPT